MIGLVLLMTFKLTSQTAVTLTYIDKYKDVAISEMQRTGIPASIKLAQAILESNSGKSVLATDANNHFGIKCGGEWSGSTYMIEDDDFDADGNKIKSCFRTYKDAEESFVEHSEFLRSPKKQNRYGFLFRLDPTDYKEWAYGLKKAGYATNPRYAEILIKIIDDYQLNKLDQGAANNWVAQEAYTGKVPQAAKKSSSKSKTPVIVINDAKVYLASEGQTPSEIAKINGVSVSNIISYNEGVMSANQKLKKGERIFLQRKRASYRGRQKWHYVQDGETMYSISQLYGIRLDKFLSKNRLNKNEEPSIGERVKISGWFKVSSDHKPLLRSKIQNVLPTKPTDNATPDPDVAAEAVVVPPKVMPASVVTVASADKPAAAQKSSPQKPEPVKEKIPAGNPGMANSSPRAESSNSGGLATHTHTVEKGDTLYNISKRYGMTIDELKSLNGMSDNYIAIGQQLKVKGS